MSDTKYIPLFGTVVALTLDGALQVYDAEHDLWLTLAQIASIPVSEATWDSDGQLVLDIDGELVTTGV